MLIKPIPENSVRKSPNGILKTLKAIIFPVLFKRYFSSNKINIGAINKDKIPNIDKLEGKKSIKTKLKITIKIPIFYLT